MLRCDRVSIAGESSALCALVDHNADRVLDDLVRQVALSLCQDCDAIVDALLDKELRV
jgi:hypothetical protein